MLELLYIINSIIGSGSYLFKSSKVKLDMLKDDKVSVKTKTKIIRSLLPKMKQEQLGLLFDFESNPDLFNDSFQLFKSLAYYDKISALEPMSFTSYKEEILKNMPHRQLIRAIINYDLDYGSKSYAISLLTKQEKKHIYNFFYLLNPDACVQLLKYFDEDKTRKLLNNKRKFNSLSCDNKVELLSYLNSDEEKLECFIFPNKYNLNLYNYEKINLAKSLSESKKLEFIDGLWDNKIKINNSDRKDFIKSLSDKIKMANFNYFYSFFEKNVDELFSSFSRDYSRSILKNINGFNCKDVLNYHKEYIICLINNLDIEERLEFLELNNKYNISLNTNLKLQIVSKLPTKYKLDIISNNSIYNLDLDEENIVKIIKSMSALSIIPILIINEDIKLKLSKKSIWIIIESLSRVDAKRILSNNDPKVQSFIETYKTSFVKCLDVEDKIKIITNKSNYNIHLEDERKIKIIKSISKYLPVDFPDNDNIFNYFNNKELIINSLVKDKSAFENLHEVIQEQLVMYLMNINLGNPNIELGRDIINYCDRAEEILAKYNLFIELFNKLNIDTYDFFQYGINSNKYNWCDSILNILNNNNIEKFSVVKSYFFNNYYNINGDSKDIIQKFLEILDSYCKYEELCMNLAVENMNLSNEDKEDIRYLFNLSKVDKIPVRLEELSTIRNEKIKLYKSVSQNSTSLFELKDALSRVLFDKSFDDIIKIISYTGNTEELKILQFNNKNNDQVNKMVERLTPVTSLIESIINTRDIDGLKKELEFYCSEGNLEHTKRIFNYCSRYEEFNRKLYEYDLKASLTSINNIDKKLYNTSKAKELFRRYGGDAIDLSETQYVLGAHVKSSRETIEDLISGGCDGKSNFICLSPVSHRGQHYYYGWNDSTVVLAYDSIPDDSFVCSSTSNMGSNGSLKYNSTEIDPICRTQKNVLETSEANTGNNAEILLYRSGLKPCGIIIPTGTEPSELAIKYHKEFKLPFIITQALNKRIDNPNRLDNENKIELDIEQINDIEVLKEIKTATLKNIDKDKKKVAVLADPHALYEPTLACLNDIKSRGIDEIYSLGDNIGHGPNPKETLELLDKYGVKSIYGNHELYLIDDNAIEELKEHFPSQESIERTRAMNNWMKTELTKEQIEEIKKYPEKYEIPVGDKKITLIHTNRPYNTTGKYSNSPIIDKDSFVVMGHEHFASSQDNIVTLRGVGIGQTDTDDGYAMYYIIDTSNDECDITSVRVKYDRDNLLHTINESNMPVLAKSLITDWVGKKS